MSSRQNRLPRPSSAISLTLASVVTLTAGHALAAGSRSNTPEYFYQPAVNGMAVSLTYAQLLPQPTITNSSQGIKISDTVYTANSYLLNFAYAFSDAWSVNAGVDTGETKTTLTDQFGSASRKFTGIGDLHVQLTNITVLGSWNLHVGVGVGLSPGKRVEPTSTADGNRLSGGTSLENYLGLSTMLGSGNYFGFKLAYDTMMERTDYKNTQDVKIDGGNLALLEAFLESEFVGFTADLTGGAEFFDPATWTYPGGGQESYGAYSAFKAGASLAYQFPGSVNLRLGYDLTSFSDRPLPTTQDNAHTEGVANARLRYEF